VTVAARVASVALAAGMSLACRAAHNYLDRDGPRYEGRHARPRAPVTPASVRVVTFNIQFARRMDEAIAGLRERPALRDPDLLLLQEMDPPGVEAAAQALGLNYVYFPSARHRTTGRDFGNAILSPWPIEEAWKLPLPHPSWWDHLVRAASCARVRIGQRAVRVYSIHLGAPFETGGAARRSQAEVILEDARESPDPVVIGGDLNNEEVGQTFMAHGLDWPTRYLGGTRGRLSFDHVFTRGLRRVDDGAGVVRDVDASDHRPVWAILGMPPDSRRSQMPAYQE
jgi:endonuclease/exonuclease/phosphatase family metal-dependent hydrolase